ncbi:Piso0_003794 [Millerozyma farinosa CBS 7064]|uniref:Piso0_003794 protein n=1 Tax=Pichia sorbitophila (strain ATCC MYA-4447 / BCRC 22081 / CBS 7064 / NBRC 10061 / NRRL Y-12695) TaxID=559304 RepID=G8Y6M3_PICSO|nr:Piso0_003794 [Millerozyma farinosa CBS 7064]CCE84253.1 Piso0_003794 [Millerozyma farinosa CBS 7064]
MSAEKQEVSSDLPEVIKIDDISSGKIDAKLIYQELDRLKFEVNILRNDLSLFLQSLGHIPPSTSQMEYYKVVTTRLDTLQKTIKQYCQKYNRMLPILNLAQIKLGNEVETLSQNKNPGAAQPKQQRQQQKVSPKKQMAAAPTRRPGAQQTLNTNIKNGLTPAQSIEL